MPVANRIVRPPCPLAGRGLLSLSHSGSWRSCPWHTQLPSPSLAAGAPALGRTQHLSLAAGAPALGCTQHHTPAAGAPALGCTQRHTPAAGAPALGCTQRHTLSLYSTPRMVGVATVAAGQEQQRRSVQHLADAGPLHQWLIAGCSAVAGSMELFRWTGTPRRWSYWQCSIGQHRRCCCTMVPW